ncbi:MAG TPA: signal recognition particle-docking protein FtsY [bacterium]|nr:signal recognition particle-docking protein FtsY [bacterium]
MSWLERLRDGLARTRTALGDRIAQALGKSSKEFQEDLEAALIQSDVGVATTQRILQQLAQRRDATDPAGRVAVLREIMVDLLGPPSPLRLDPPPAAVLVLGVNGVGKTTTIGKLAYRLRHEGRSVLLAAADTFRAAAIDQLTVWAQRVGCELVSHRPGADPAAVVFDAAAAVKARGIAVMIADTAGRLHTKAPLMDELKKIDRVLTRELPAAPIERLLVLDATLGQNGVVQAQVFTQAVAVTGVVLAKLDGSAKGGVVLAVASELHLPVKLVGIGEGVEDLQEFDPQQFVDALLPPFG